MGLDEGKQDKVPTVDVLVNQQLTVDVFRRREASLNIVLSVGLLVGRSSKNEVS